MPEKKGTQETRRKGKHSWNSCGSEARKGERKHTGSLSTGTGKECTGNQAGKNGENRRSESKSGALRKPLWGRDRKKRERKKQRLSSQNPKLKRTKESENSGGQKEKRKRRQAVKVEAQRSRKGNWKARVSRKKQLQRLKPAEDERKLQTKRFVKQCVWRSKD